MHRQRAPRAARAYALANRDHLEYITAAEKRWTQVICSGNRLTLGLDYRDICFRATDDDKMFGYSDAHAGYLVHEAVAQSSTEAVTSEAVAGGVATGVSTAFSGIDMCEAGYRKQGCIRADADVIHLHERSYFVQEIYGIAKIPSGNWNPKNRAQADARVTVAGGACICIRRHEQSAL